MVFHFKIVLIKVGIKQVLYLKYLIFQLNIISFLWYKKVYMTNNSWGKYIKNFNATIYILDWF
jgi:hypothetical protein